MAGFSRAGRGRVVLLLCLATILGFLVHLQSTGALSLHEIQIKRTEWAELARTEPIFFAAAFFVVATILSALTLPGLLVLSVVAGNIFGIAEGFLLAWLASGTGATLAFWTSRFLLRDLVGRRFARPLARVNEGVERDGSTYLLTLRLIPVFPAGAVNVLTGLTSLPAKKFFVVSLLGMIPAVLIYANAGTRLARLDSLEGVLTPGGIASLAAIGCLPLFGKFVARGLQNYREPRGPENGRGRDQVNTTESAGRPPVR